MLDEVVRRGEGLRRRRRAVTGLAGGFTVLLAVAGLAAVAGRGGDHTTQLAASGPTTTASGFQASGGTIVPVDMPATTSVAEETPAAEAGTVRTTIPADVEGTETVATPPPTITASTVPATPPPCTPDLLEVSLTFPQLTYRVGERIVGQGVLRNRSGAPCLYTSYTQSQEFRDAAGNPVSLGSAIIADAFVETPLAPGQTLMAAPEWDQRICGPDPSCPPAPPGTYSGTVSWSFDGPPILAAATFRVVA